MNRFSGPREVGSRGCAVITHLRGASLPPKEILPPLKTVTPQALTLAPGKQQSIVSWEFDYSPDPMKVGCVTVGTLQLVDFTQHSSQRLTPLVA